MFELELKTMKIYSFGRAKQKKYKNMALKLSAITKQQKTGLLKEYFSMCKMIYRIRSLAAYTWDHGEDSFHLTMELYS